MVGKRTVSQLLAFMLVAAAAAGCSSGNDAKSSASDPSQSSATSQQSNASASQQAEPEEDTTPVTIQYWNSHNERQQAGLNKIIEDFQKEYPYITVKPVFQGAYADLAKKLFTAQAANDVPALTVAENSAMPSMAYNGLLEDLGPYIKASNVDVGDFSKGMMSAYAYDGVQYGIPFLVSMNVILYNKTMLDQAGIKAPETWDDMNNLSKVVKKDGNGGYSTVGLAFSYSELWDLEPWLINGGGVEFKDGKSGLDLPESQKFIKQFEEWRKEGIIYPLTGKDAATTRQQMFYDGATAMFQTSSSSIAKHQEAAKFEVGALFIPGDQQRKAEIGGASLVIMKSAPEREKQAAWKFIQFVTSAEHNIEYSSALGYLPTHRSVIDTPEGKQYFDNAPYLRNLYDHFDDVVSRPQLPAFAATKAPTVEIFERIALGDADIDTAFKEGVPKINEAIANYK